MVTEKLNVCVVDDDESVRKSLSRLIVTIGYQVTTFSGAEEFLEKAESCNLSCVILDVCMPGLSGLDLQEELNRRNIWIPIIFITGHGDIPMSVKAMKAGAVDFLPKPFNDQNLIDAIERSVIKFNNFQEEKIKIDSLQELVYSLTPREKEVFQLVITGMLNKQIAAELGAAEKTIKVHRGRVMEKLQVKSVAELVCLAQKIGIISE